LDHNNLSCKNSRIQKVFYTTQNYKDLGVKGEIVNQTDSEQDKDKKSKIKTNEDGEDNNIIRNWDIRLRSFLVILRF
jgi:hypothetical protein